MTCGDIHHGRSLTCEPSRIMRSADFIVDMPVSIRQDVLAGSTSALTGSCQGARSAGCRLSFTLPKLTQGEPLPRFFCRERRNQRVGG